MKFYRNGEYIGSESSTLSYPRNYSTADPNDSFIIGARDTNSGSDITPLNGFFGNISNVKIYNRALTADEVAQNFNTTKKRYGL